MAEQAVFVVGKRGYELVGASPALERVPSVRSWLDQALERYGNVEGAEPGERRALIVLPPEYGLWPLLRLEERALDASGRDGAPQVQVLAFDEQELASRKRHPLEVVVTFGLPEWREAALENEKLEPARFASLADTGDERPGLSDDRVELAGRVVDAVLSGERAVVVSYEDEAPLLAGIVAALPSERARTLDVATRAFSLRRPAHVTVVSRAVAAQASVPADMRVFEVGAAASESGKEGVGRFMVEATLAGQSRELARIHWHATVASERGRLAGLAKSLDLVAKIDGSARPGECAIEAFRSLSDAVGASALSDEDVRAVVAPLARLDLGRLDTGAWKALLEDVAELARAVAGVPGGSAELRALVAAWVEGLPAGVELPAAGVERLFEKALLGPELESAIVERTAKDERPTGKVAALRLSLRLRRDGADAAAAALPRADRDALELARALVEGDRLGAGDAVALERALVGRRPAVAIALAASVAERERASAFRRELAALDPEALFSAWRSGEIEALLPSPTTRGEDERLGRVLGVLDDIHANEVASPLARLRAAADRHRPGLRWPARVLGRFAFRWPRATTGVLGVGVCALLGTAGGPWWLAVAFAAGGIACLAPWRGTRVPEVE